MDDQRLGRITRALRRRRGWRQIDLAAVAGCSQNVISLIERGHLDRLSLRTVRRILAALDALVVLDIRWRGAAVERLLDEGHAAIVAAVADRLRRLGWLVEVEVTYSENGEHGSYDVLAFWPAPGILLVIEVKTDIPSAEAMLRKLDEKTRLGTDVARKRFGWRAKSVARLLVCPESATVRRRIARRPVFAATLPERNVAIRQWLRRPVGSLAGIWFFSERDGRVAISAVMPHERVRRTKSPPNNPCIVA
jgi:transcriptional regulator with XRE-family HTH domain